MREPHSLTARMDALLFWAALAAKALGGAAALLIVSWASETAYYQGLKWLERLGAIERLAPQIKETDTKYKAQTAWTSFLSAAFVLFIALHPRNLQPLLDLAEPRLDWLEVRDRANTYTHEHSVLCAVQRGAHRGAADVCEWQPHVARIAQSAAHCYRRCTQRSAML